MFELVSSCGRNDSISTYDDIMFAKCKPNECYPLENLDVSQITDLSYIFRESPYNGDLSKLDVSNCTNMDRMFAYSEFNKNSIKDWNTSNVDSMNFIFSNSNFDKDLSNWDFNKITMSKYMFLNNNEFKYKYNDVKKIPFETKEILEWLKENKLKIKEINTTKEEVLDFFSFDNNELNLNKMKRLI